MRQTSLWSGLPPGFCSKLSVLLELAELVEVSRENGLVLRQRCENISVIAGGAEQLVGGGDFVFQ